MARQWVRPKSLVFPWAWFSHVDIGDHTGHLMAFSMTLLDKAHPAQWNWGHRDGSLCQPAGPALSSHPCTQQACPCWWFPEFNQQKKK